jgi:hypothetical protein
VNGTIFHHKEKNSPRPEPLPKVTCGISACRATSSGPFLSRQVTPGMTGCCWRSSGGISVTRSLTHSLTLVLACIDCCHFAVTCIEEEQSSGGWYILLNIVAAIAV